MKATHNPLFLVDSECEVERLELQVLTPLALLL